jgi:hypothetical protein
LKNKQFIAFGLLMVFMAASLPAAVGCDLNDPDRDVKRLFPGSTGFKTLYVTIAQKGGLEMLQRVEARLGDKFKGLYETADVPYTMYQIFKGRELIGYIHGVNQKGEYGGIQVFLALDLQGNIRAFYFQKLTGRYAKLLRADEFARQFVGLNLGDFAAYDVITGRAGAGNRVAAIMNPADEFLLGNKYL